MFNTEKYTSKSNEKEEAKFNVTDFCKKHDVGISSIREARSTTIYTLAKCPFCDGSDTAEINDYGHGHMGFRCTCAKHNNKDIKDFIRNYEPAYFVTKDMKEATEINSLHSSIAYFNSFIRDPSSFCPKSTGFKLFDNYLSGGILPGITCLMAEPSAGKTTFAEQLAEQCAKNGGRVLFFSTEMTVEELIARGLSRMAHCIYMDQGKDKKKFPGAPEITEKLHDGEHAFLKSAHRDLTDEEWDTMDYLTEMQDENLNGNLYFFGGERSAKEIAEIVEYFNAKVGTPDLVVIDYLQHLSAAEENKGKDEKQKIDSTLKTLKTLRRKLNIAIIVISSVARGAYKGNLDMASAKESGNIEYDCDRLWALSNVVDEEHKNLELATAPNLHYSRIKILKNRGGATGQEVIFSYERKYNLFAEITAFDASGRPERGNSTDDKTPHEIKTLEKRLGEIRKFYETEKIAGKSSNGRNNNAPAKNVRSTQEEQDAFNAISESFFNGGF